MLATLPVAALWRFVLLFGLIYAAFGVASPFLPAFLATRCLAPEEISLVLGAGTAIRLISGPAVGRVADRLRALRPLLGLTLALAAAAALGYLPGTGFAMQRAARFALCLELTLGRAALLWMLSRSMHGTRRDRALGGFEFCSTSLDRHSPIRPITAAPPRRPCP
jgi:cyanate permease